MFFRKEHDMKGGRNLAEMKQEKEELEGWVKWKPCTTCGREIAGAYGRHYDGKTERWTCSGKCERAYQSKKKETQDVLDSA